MRGVIIKPIITEKSMNDAAKGSYTFKVNMKSTKDDIKVAIEKLYGVHVRSVATQRVKGTKTRFNRLGKNVTDISYKKARIKVKKGEKIGIFEEILAEASK